MRDLKILNQRQKYYQKNKEKIKQKAKEYYYANRDIVRQREQTKRKANPRWVKHHNLKAKYNISLEEYENKFRSQGEKCGICEVKLTLGKESHLDHCHSTGKIRDFLCEDCNKGLGRFKDSPHILSGAIEYLKRHFNDY